MLTAFHSVKTYPMLYSIINATQIERSMLGACPLVREGNFLLSPYICVLMEDVKAIGITSTYFNTWRVVRYLKIRSLTNKRADKYVQMKIVQLNRH